MLMIVKTHQEKVFPTRKRRIFHHHARFNETHSSAPSSSRSYLWSSVGEKPIQQIRLHKWDYYDVSNSNICVGLILLECCKTLRWSFAVWWLRKKHEKCQLIWDERFVVWNFIMNLWSYLVKNYGKENFSCLSSMWWKISFIFFFGPIKKISQIQIKSIEFDTGCHLESVDDLCFTTFHPNYPIIIDSRCKQSTW